MRNNRSSPHNGPIKKTLPQNLIIYAYLTMKKYKIQNRSQKNSHSCVPLRSLHSLKDKDIEVEKDIAIEGYQLRQVAELEEMTELKLDI